MLTASCARPTNKYSIREICEYAISKLDLCLSIAHIKITMCSDIHMLVIPIPK